MSELTEILTLLNQPYSLAALLAVIIYLQVKNQRKITTNHLHTLPETFDLVKGMAQDIKDMKVMQQTMNDNIVVIRTKVTSNGVPKS